MKIKLIVATLALFVSVATFAQAPQKADTTERKKCYVDADNNKTCDKADAGTCANSKDTAKRKATCDKKGYKPADTKSTAKK